MNKKIAITVGDFNGISVEIITKALNKLNIEPEKIVIIGSKLLFKNLKNNYQFIEIPFNEEWINYGVETKEAGEFSYKCLEKACELAKSGLIKAIVTAPVSKNAMHMANYKFSGQTEVLQKFLENPLKDEEAEMLFVANDFRVLLLTRHIPLNNVKITKELLVEKVKRINRVLSQDFGIKNPKIALCSLNPHAGENGVLGNEEIDVFFPAIHELRELSIDVSNPLPSDTLFTKASKAYFVGNRQPFDVYCACYHDQGLIPIKAVAMDKTVNMTVGLSIVRTSPAHGTAYDIAGKNIADESSMISAIQSVL